MLYTFTVVVNLIALAVAVDNSLLMGIVQSGGEVLEQWQPLVEGQTSLSREDL